MQQNLQTTNETTNKNLDLAQAQDLAQASSSSSLPVAEQKKSDSLEAVQSEPESRIKIKSRSRFSTAIRKLSGSRRKKDKTQEKPTEIFISSGGEDNELPTTSTAEDKASKKKTGLSKRFLLSSLSKKSKVSPKTSIDADEDNEERNATIDAFLVENEQAAKVSEKLKSSTKSAKSKVAATATEVASKQSKVQITISGKKASAKSPKTDLKSSTTKALPSEAEQTKKSTELKVPSGSSSTSEAAAKAKKKLKTKKISTSSHTTTGDTSDTSETKIAAKSKETTEKFIVTQTTRDTPPSERAPLKPSRSGSVSSTFSQSQAGNETPTVIRKTITRPTSKLTSSPSLAQRFIGGATKLKKQQAVSVEAELMQDPKASALQRGHRLPRPALASASASPITNLNVPPTYPPPPVPLSSASTPLEASNTRPHSSTTDDIPSSAGSAAQLAETDTDQRPISQTLSDEATEAALREAGLSLRKQGTIGSQASNLSSSSDSPLTNSSRRHVTYVSDPIPYDFEGRRQHREDLNFSAEAAEHAYDTDDMEEEMEPVVITAVDGEKREHLYKILVIGELGTGKTSFIKRYVHQFFSQNYRATIGVDFALKVLHWDADTIVRLQLWDIAGQERFGNMTRVYYKEAVGAFIVFDITRNATFDCVNKWKEDLDSKVQLPDGSPIPCILLANKCDQEKQGIVTQPEKLNEYVRNNGFVSWFETSAKDNINIDEAARALVNQILLNDKLIAAGDLADSGKLSLEKSSHEDAKNKCSC